jgi:hypothetical protein
VSPTRTGGFWDTNRVSAAKGTACSKELSLMAFSVSNVVEDKTCKVGCMASGPAKGRAKLVDQPNIEWLDEIHTADSMYLTSRNV